MQSFSQLTSLRTGGAIPSFTVCRSAEEAIQEVSALTSEGREFVVLGGCSNVIAPDEPFAPHVILLEGAQVDFPEVFAGAKIDDLVGWSVDHGFTGLEPLSGIPGTVGGAIVQNAGAYGVEVSEVLTGIQLLSSKTGQVSMVKPETLDFKYRASRLKSQRVSPPEIVLSANFKLEKFHPSVGVHIPSRLKTELERTALKDETANAAHTMPGTPVELRQRVLALRESKDMLEDPRDSAVANHNRWSCGSFFTNPVVLRQLADTLPPNAPRYPSDSPDHVKIGAAWLIEATGFPRGFSPANKQEIVGLSTSHALAITNRGRAETRDVLAFAKAISDAVFEKFQIRLEMEPVVL